MQQKKRLDIPKPKTIEEKERMRLTIKALKFGLISEEQAIKLGYKPKKLKSLPKLQKFNLLINLLHHEIAFVF